MNEWCHVGKDSKLAISFHPHSMEKSCTSPISSSCQSEGAQCHARRIYSRKAQGERRKSSNRTNQKRRRIAVGEEEDGGFSCCSGGPGVWRCILTRWDEGRADRSREAEGQPRKKQNPSWRVCGTKRTHRENKITTKEGGKEKEHKRKY